MDSESIKGTGPPVYNGEWVLRVLVHLCTMDSEGIKGTGPPVYNGQ